MPRRSLALRGRPGCIEPKALVTRVPGGVWSASADRARCLSQARRNAGPQRHAELRGGQRRRDRCGRSRRAAQQDQHRSLRQGILLIGRGPDCRRPQYVAARGKLLVPAIDHGLGLGARGLIRCEPGGASLDAVSARPWPAVSAESRPQSTPAWEMSSPTAAVGNQVDGKRRPVISSASAASNSILSQRRSQTEPMAEGDQEYGRVPVPMPMGLGATPLPLGCGA
jgi:hypothetical protein